ncbi:spermidine/putrescine ABC transporter substrate-binding protein PotF [Pseudomonas sp. UMC65]|uniref:polyamine ABC transporter substrate-binding protein n=1 Tax=unclassified Pseudomonas TaxID=196821 RepID=UPI00217FF76D|nr:MULTISPECIES: polyamine ABC transporter substrate-binding protein [unclassified Pseudomonas]MBB1616570.1 spermidine/putrescine ABC transporter substrate-binding protein PotF [Pseudomonas sp. UMC65]MBB1618070.1 spermidine/putrescine ABC transporter substrate-binding protein PotF [Pseudomonas sp. UME65]
MINRTTTALLSLALCAASVQAAETVSIANWSGYIAPDTLAQFTQRTAIQTTYDVIDSNETTEAKLMTGGSGYDLASPSNHFLPRLIQAGAIQPLDRSKLPNWNNLDPKLMKLLETSDPGNRYGIPYMWVTVGIGYNVDKIKAIFGDTDVTHSWQLLFKPENIQKLKQCGVAFLDNPTQMVPITLNALGLDPHSEQPADLKKAEAALQAIRPSILYFHQAKYVSDLANGNICVAVGFSGDVLQAMATAQQAKNGVNLGYSIPREGSTVAMDMVVIPRNAPHLDNAYAYLNYLLDPKVIANISNFVQYANGNAASLPYIEPQLRSNPAAYPPQSVLDTLFPIKTMTPAGMRLSTRLWTRVVSGT